MSDLLLYTSAVRWREQVKPRYEKNHGWYIEGLWPMDHMVWNIWWEEGVYIQVWMDKNKSLDDSKINFSLNMKYLNKIKTFDKEMGRTISIHFSMYRKIESLWGNIEYKLSDYKNNINFHIDRSIDR